MKFSIQSSFNTGQNFAAGLFRRPCRRLNENNGDFSIYPSSVWKHNSNNIKETADTRSKAEPDLIANFVVCQQLVLLATLGSKLQLNDNLKFPTWIKDCHKPAWHRNNKVEKCLMLAGVATLQQRQMAGLRLVSRYFGGNHPGHNVKGYSAQSWQT